MSFRFRDLAVQLAQDGKPQCNERTCYGSTEASTCNYSKPPCCPGKADTCAPKTYDPGLLARLRQQLLQARTGLAEG